MRVIDFLIENTGYDYTKTEIAKRSGIDWSTLSKMLDKMERYRLIVSVRKEKEKLYRLNEKNSLVKDLLSLELDLIDEYSEEEMVVPVNG
ncbi:hypothetical protein ES705_03461 [subsurface metagenome]|nr:hypothetical protein [Methanosarcinales archaeon]